MKLIALDCNHCGAPLEVPRKLRSVTCAFCNTKLAIKHEGSAIYTEAIEQIAAGVEKLVKQGEVEQLDREWEMRRKGFVSHKRSGSSDSRSLFKTRIRSRSLVSESSRLEF